jgi:hypothetical protein|tara:strand:+ start:385 stop:840 length:456 start_codon:yes stop_codon:yes gene_type:complete
MSYKGKFRPKNPNKYKGNPSNIIYRSLLERRFMVYLDNNPSILKWSSEEIIIPYVSPVDNRVHRYFPDFYMKYRNNKDMIVEELIEVKPFSQCTPPNPKKKLTKTGRTSKRYLKEVQTYMVNDAKWSQAMKYCKDRKWKWRILTEKDINIY